MRTWSSTLPEDRIPPALVLTAGLGTRLAPLTTIRAKAAVPVNGEPLVRRIIRNLVRQDIRDLVLNLHHRPATITAVVGDGSDLDARVRYSWEQPVLGSAGGPRRALPLLATHCAGWAGEHPAATGHRDWRGFGTFLIVNGDTLTDVRIDDLLAAHRASGAAITMALIRNPRPDKYGGVTVSPDGWVTGFTRRGAAVESYHFIGVQAAEARVFAALEDGVPAESVSGIYRTLLAADPHAVRAFISAASFQDIGTPADYLETSLRLAAQEGDCLAAGKRTRIAPSAVLTRTVVWDDVVVGENVRLSDCIVCDGARVPPGVQYERCAILPAGGAAPPHGPAENAVWVQPLDRT